MKLSRRDFIKFSGLALGALALPSWPKNMLQSETPFPVAGRLGRICQGNEGARFDLKAEPNVNAANVGIVWRDEVVVWQREVVSNPLNFNEYNQKWVQTPTGFIQTKFVQPVKNLPNQLLSELPMNQDGTRGMWVEVTVPLVDVKPAVPPISYWIREVLKPRIYYSQVFWAYDLRQVNGTLEYRLMQKYGALPDNFWVDATACRPITSEEVSPIHPDATDKHITVDLNYQTLSCWEGEREVYFCEVATGGIIDGKWVTPVGKHTIWRKILSTHMSAGGLWSFDAPGIAWTTLFDPNGAAIHATYWHNNFGTALSHGCVNCLPEDAKWIWRWTQPDVDYIPGELTVQGDSRSTKVEVFA